MIFSPLLRDCRSQLQTAASCALYKCNHISAVGTELSVQRFDIGTIIAETPIFYTNYIVPATVLEGEIVINLSVLIYTILPAFVLSGISTPENSYPKKGASFQVSILSYSDFTIFSHQTQYFDTFFQYPVKRNRTASLEQDILFHT